MGSDFDYIDAGSADIVEKTLPIDSTCQIGLITLLKSILIVDFGCIAGMREFARRDPISIILTQAAKISQNGYRKWIRHIK